MEPHPELEKIGRIFRDTRIEAGYDGQTEAFAERLGISQPHLSRVERGLKPPSFALIQKLSDKFGMNNPEAMKTLLSFKGAKALLEEDPATARVKVARSKTRAEGFAPVIGRANCGSFDEMLAAGRQATGEVETKEMPYPTKDRQACWIEAWGDSMTGEIPTDDGFIRIQPGDHLFVEPSRKPINDKPALVEYRGEVTVKIWRAHKDGVDLIPTNRKHRVIQLSNEDLEHVRAARITFHDPKPRAI